jgi:uncharacterized protein YhaN
MRIDQLELIRYGKFTDRKVALPRGEQDFHVVVGANEAGKSTLRAALSDLLYGFPKSPPHAFLHPMSELRLGAVLHQGDDTLHFHRTKGLKQTVRGPDDQPLPDGTLTPYLGASDRGFFEQMFGLNHQRLIDGGHHILTAGSDIGQMLFESAAGVASLGTVRDALQAEADKLWSPRKAKDRPYYAALDDYEAAVAELKKLTVRTKDWADAQAQVVRLEADLRAARASHAALTARRTGLERIRRVAPYVADLRKRREDMAALGETPELPDDAARRLAEAERELALAESQRKTQLQIVAECDAALQGLSPDARLIALHEDILALNEWRLQYRAHAGDILRRQAEVDAQWLMASNAARQLGWGAASEAELRERMPPLPLRRSLDDLMRKRGARVQAVQAAAQALEVRQRERDRVRRQLDALPQGEVPLALRAAVQAAQQLGDTDATQRKHRLDVQRLEARADATAAALGAWRAPADTLRAMSLPRLDAVDALRQHQAADAAERRALDTRLARLDDELRKQSDDADRYRDTWQPVSRDEVLAARNRRDDAWARIASGEAVLPLSAPDYDALVRDADSVADRREATIQEASELRRRQEELARLTAEREQMVAQQERLHAADAARRADWSATIAAHGLPGMAPEAVADWMAARAAAIAAADLLADARREAASWDAAVAAATQDLHAALQDEPERPVRDERSPSRKTVPQRTAPTMAPLPRLLLEASARIQQVSDAHGQRRALDTQWTDATVAVDDLARALDAAQVALNEWEAAWRQAASGVGIAADADLAHAQASLELVADIDAALTEMSKLRIGRIETMRADLAKFDAEAQRLGALAGLPLADQGAADIAIALQQQATAAMEQQAEVKRLTTARSAAAKGVADAIARQDALSATLRPWMTQAGATTHDELAAAIARSDRHRQLREALAAAEQRLAESGDGLGPDALFAEVDASDPAGLSAQLSALTVEADALMDSQNLLSAQLASAQAALNAMAGSDDAARAEGRKQESVSRMTGAVERYLKVATAARLLKWSVDRYRETRQGPMLKRASDIFCGLTLGSFELLAVDFDSEPLTLMGKRPGGSLVPVEGMSEGTRDQLYLALRLAALHQHLQHALALPFVADDLFINYDDARSRAGLRALGDLSRHTQVVFLTHHDHLVPVIQEVLGKAVNVVAL